MQQYRLEAGQRAVFLAQPSAGKTNLQAWLLEQVSSAVVLDSKRHPAEWASWGPRHGYIVTSDPDAIAKHPKVVFQVDQLSLDDRAGWLKPGRPGHVWTEALARITARGQTVAVFDEVLQTMPAGSAHPQARRLLTQGAAFGVSAWSGSQIPNRMETLVIRLAEHCFAFTTLNQQDQAIIQQARGIDCSELAELETYQFAYHRSGAPGWLICNPVPLVMKPRVFGHGQGPSRSQPAEPPEIGNVPIDAEPESA